MGGFGGALKQLSIGFASQRGKTWIHTAGNITDWKKMENQIYTNLLILQEYRNFPFEIYEWIHVIDRYMSEIASLINNTM